MHSTESDEVLNNIKILKITFIRDIPKWNGWTREKDLQRQIVT